MHVLTHTGLLTDILGRHEHIFSHTFIIYSIRTHTETFAHHTNSEEIYTINEDVIGPQ